MTNEITVQFETTKYDEVPRVGARRTVQVNGRPEIMWTREVRCEAKKFTPGEVYYVGTARYATDLWA